MRVVRDHFLPPDPGAFLAGEPPTGRVIVIAPTRAACETIELALTLRLETLLEREHGDDIRRLAASRAGFGIVAGTYSSIFIGSAALIEIQRRWGVGKIREQKRAEPATV